MYHHYERASHTRALNRVKVSHDKEELKFWKEDYGMLQLYPGSLCHTDVKLGRLSSRFPSYFYKDFCKI